MNIEYFKREHDESLIIIQCQFPTHKVALALDTGASHTTIDLTAILIAGYDINDAIKTVQLETASGIIEAYVFRVVEFKALGITRQNIEICAYDFFAHQVLAEFDGVLGLDFIGDYKICIDFKKSFISIQ
jgi:hypothetical protein